MTDFEMCQDCAGLVGAGSATAPHETLVADDTKQEFEGYGVQVDEQAYVCTVCGQRWIHETGDAGYGWIVQRLY